LPGISPKAGPGNRTDILAMSRRKCRIGIRVQFPPKPPIVIAVQWVGG